MKTLIIGWMDCSFCNVFYSKFNLYSSSSKIWFWCTTLCIKLIVYFVDALFLEGLILTYRCILTSLNFYIKYLMNIQVLTFIDTIFVRRWKSPLTLGLGSVKCQQLPLYAVVRPSNSVLAFLSIIWINFMQMVWKDFLYEDHLWKKFQ